MKVTIEQINGRPYTVIRKPFEEKLVQGQLDIGMPVVCYWNSLELQGAIYKYEIRPLGNARYYMPVFGWIGKPDYTVCILPPLPRHPKPEDAKLLHLYAAHGLMPWMKEPNGQSFAFIVAPHLVNYNSLAPVDLPRVEITHALYNGERVEMAIEGGE